MTGPHGLSNIAYISPEEFIEQVREVILFNDDLCSNSWMLPLPSVLSFVGLQKLE